ncbi:hypothetical protein M427DRAFT_58897 [Gonapodya prolifera JEL478]|uniref:Peroxisomal membrane protein PEX16 n=1 Tax=Gonapodya prolifera (strain JEL478) TaxID=1344416 RepID=A0A139A9U7_GONPJ|nr:hypothetical protein M427DRAFT_58897 [Gonapodya prolifera JEL478]|eukprot:KXS13183.1 hypothetical protein M427DRAFT_58897 [Gonapodya prolifera JEL478]
MTILSKYESFIVRNAPRIAGIERLTRAITFLLPSFHAILGSTVWKGVLPDTTYATRVLFMISDLASLFHTLVFHKYGVPRNPPGSTGQASKYFRDLFSLSTLYAKLAITSLVVIYIEQFLEMTATRKFGQKARWKVVALIEAVKCSLRLGMLSISKRMTITGRQFPDRDFDLSSNKLNAEISMREPSGSLFDGITARPKDSQPIALGDLPVPQVSGARLVGEIAWIVRPALYTFLITQHSPTSPIPFFASLSLETFSYLLAYLPLVSSTSAPTYLEREELTRRAALFLWYLLREPVYSTYVKAPMLRALAFAMRKPPMHYFFFAIAEFRSLWETIYFQTAGSS